MQRQRLSSTRLRSCPNPSESEAIQQNGGTNIPVNLCQHCQGGGEREDARRDTFRQGLQGEAVLEAELSETFQLTEPFG